MEKLDEVVGKLKSLRPLPGTQEGGGGAPPLTATIKEILLERSREPDEQTVFLFLAVSSFLLTSVVSLQKPHRAKGAAAAKEEEGELE